MPSQVIAEDCKRVLDSGIQFGLKNNIFVTGASGMLGQYTVEFFLALREILKIDLNIYVNYRKGNSYINHLVLNKTKVLHRLSNSDFSAKLLQCGENKILIHAASPSNMKSLKDDPANLLECNLIQVLEFSKVFATSGGTFTFFSSGEVYGPNPPLPTSELDFSPFNHLDLKGVYGEAKKIAELILFMKSLQNEFQFNALRIFHTFGPGINLNDPRIFGTLLKSLYYKMPISLRSDGSSKRTLMYTADLLQAILISCSRAQSSVLNVGGSEEISILDLATKVSNLSNPKLEIIFSKEIIDSHSNFLIKRGKADTTELSKLGWKNLFSIEEAFSRTLRGLQDRSSFLNV
jgi:UDP-glucuronate decarboxylase